MKLSFKRITSSGSYIPEIDGLRFIAIASVVLYHINGFIIVKDLSTYTDSFDYSFLNRVLSRGHLGVPLFFVISGFILGQPFANFYIRQGKPVNLKKYFLRRLTRLEPPYILIMTILFFGAVYVAKTVSFSTGILSYFSSIIYSHNFIYGGYPLLNAPAWSLEIEVQFYILAPLMAYIFSLTPSNRRFVLLSIAFFFVFFNNTVYLSHLSILNFVQYFLVGFLLADLYVSNSTILPKTKFDYLFGFLFFSIIWLIDKGDLKFQYQKNIWDLVQLCSIFLLYYYVLIHKIFKLLSFKLITNIGGMCYSIYLLHYPIISMFGNPLLHYSFSEYSFINISIYSISLLFLIMAISSIYFLIIERPCMDKDWYKRILNICTRSLILKRE